MSQYLKKWPLLILIANAAFFFAYTSYFSFNFPLQDDVLLIDFVVQKGNLGSDFYSWYHTFFGVVNDHSIMIPRLSVWLIQLVHDGKIDFEWITRYNLIILIIFFVIIGKEFLRAKLPLAYLLPISFLLFQPHFQEVSNWPITGLQHIHLLFFVAIALYGLENKKSIHIPIICAFLAGFSFGNGVALFILIGIYVSLENRTKQVSWVILALIVYLFLLFPVFSFSDHAKFSLSFSNTSYFFLGLLGSIALPFTKGKDEFAVILGIIILAMMSYLIFQKWIKRNLSINRFFFYLGIFILGAALMIALPRSGTDWKSYNSSRFFIYSEIILISIYGILLAAFKDTHRKYVFFIGLLISFVFSFLSYFNNSITLIERKNALQADHDNWNRNEAIICGVPQVFQNIKPILKEAYDKQLFQKEKMLVPSEDLAKLNQLAKPFKLRVPLEIQSHADTIKGKSEFWVKRYSFIIFNQMGVDNPISKAWFLVIQHDSTKKSFLSPIAFKKGAIRDFLFKPGSNYLSQGGAALIYTEFLAGGSYHVYLCSIQEKERNRYYRLNERIRKDLKTKTLVMIPYKDPKD
jgi:hypothetical protein